MLWAGSDKFEIALELIRMKIKNKKKSQLKVKIINKLIKNFDETASSCKTVHIKKGV